MAIQETTESLIRLSKSILSQQEATSVVELMLNDGYLIGSGQVISFAIVTISKESESNRNSRKSKLEGLRIRWNAFRKFGGNPRETLYYFLKSLAGLISPSDSHLDR